MTSEQQIIKQGYETFGSFLEMLDGPNDIYKQVVLEEFFKILFEIIYKEKN